MNEQTQTVTNDTLAKDFYAATFVVSILVNLIVATSWMVIKLAA